MKKYFRVYRNYTDYVSIDETELEKALYAAKMGYSVTFNDGFVSKIETVVPDLHRAMGWNPTHKLDSDDYNEMRSCGIEKKYSGVIGMVKERIEFLIANGQTNLIGKNPIPDGQRKIESSGMKSIGEILA